MGLTLLFTVELGLKAVALSSSCFVSKVKYIDVIVYLRVLGLNCLE